MVSLTVKTIKGKKFQIVVEPTQTVLEVKRVIEATNAEFPAAQLKLIHSGKILKDEHTLEEYKIKEDEFLVCMVTKLKPSASAPPPQAGSVAAPSTSTAASVSAPATAPPAAAPPAAAPAAPSPVAADSSLNEDHIRQLTDMGFPEDQARAALRAALGNPDLAVEFLTAGAPDNFQAATSTPSQATPPPSGTMETLDDFRGHPQFNELKRLVQRDPAMLSTVLQMIGQQSPNLLARIHENQQQFIELMNEPVDESAPPAAPAAPPSGTGALGSITGSGASAGYPAQMAHILQSMTPAQRAHTAAAMGVSPQQLAQISEAIGNMPREQFQQLMAAVGGGGIPGGGMGALRGMAAGGGAAGRNVIHLTEEEGAAVARLAELGFDRTDAAQAYLACDKNEALAANLLMDGMGAAVQPTFYAPAPSPSSQVAGAPAPGSSVASSSTSGTDSTSPPAPSPTAASSSDPAASGDQSTATEGGGSSASNSQPEEGSGGDEDEDMYG